ncbi:hypothetical protein HYH02_012345 [Chlamydomonas schloesseri]|uniref:Uncharacterized protein n=1 Tax=Chlamydomonas schloesseri TaxID=2026947 RepID=A0A835W200_9CHLO|nr:hypothetical protein HYH02_012345 [Chlamydomonas schloesseri]|eukprot:KAG2434323.1 hypothetical protein HYH02_012345 [Chlamydomonas schloesseri]
MQLSGSFKAALLRGAAAGRSAGTAGTGARAAAAAGGSSSRSSAGPVPGTAPAGAAGAGAAAGFSSREGPAETGPPSPQFEKQPDTSARSGEQGNKQEEGESQRTEGAAATANTSPDTVAHQRQSRTSSATGVSDGDGAPHSGGGSEEHQPHQHQHQHQPHQHQHQQHRRLVEPAAAPLTDEDGGAELPPGHDGSGSTLTSTADQSDA